VQQSWLTRKFWSLGGAYDGFPAPDRRSTMSQKPRTTAPARPTPPARVATQPAPADVKANAPAAQEPGVEIPAEVAAAPVTTPQPDTPSEIMAIAAETERAADDSAAKATEASAAISADAINEITTTAVQTAETVAAAAASMTDTTTSTPTFTRGIKSMMKTTEEFVAFSQANMEAFVRSGQIWSAGMQDLTKQIASSAKASFDESVSTFKAISSAKSVKEAMELQSSFAKSALEKMMAESNKLTDASIKLTEETLAPITARVGVAVETFKPA